MATNKLTYSVNLLLNKEELEKKRDMTLSEYVKETISSRPKISDVSEKLVGKYFKRNGSKPNPYTYFCKVLKVEKDNSSTSTDMLSVQVNSHYFDAVQAYSKSLIVKEIPADMVEITEDEHSTLMKEYVKAFGGLEELSRHSINVMNYCLDVNTNVDYCDYLCPTVWLEGNATTRIGDLLDRYYDKVSDVARVLKKIKGVWLLDQSCGNEDNDFNHVTYIKILSVGNKNVDNTYQITVASVTVDINESNVVNNAFIRTSSLESLFSDKCYVMIEKDNELANTNELIILLEMKMHESQSANEYIKLNSKLVKNR